MGGDGARRRFRGRRAIGAADNTAPSGENPDGSGPPRAADMSARAA